MDDRTMILTGVMALVLGLNRLLSKDLPRFRNIPTIYRALGSAVLGLAYSGGEMVLKGTTLKQALVATVFIAAPPVFLNAVEGWAGGPGVPDPVSVAKAARRASMRGLVSLMLVLSMGTGSLGCAGLTSASVKSAIDEVTEYLSDFADALAVLEAVKAGFDQVTRGQVVPAATEAKVDKAISDAATTLHALGTAAQGGKALASKDYATALADFKTAWDGVTVALKDAGVSVPALGSVRADRYMPTSAMRSFDMRPRILDHSYPAKPQS